MSDEPLAEFGEDPKDEANTDGEEPHLGRRGLSAQKVIDAGGVDEKAQQEDLDGHPEPHHLRLMRREKRRLQCS